MPAALILASASPRRHELLARLGATFSVVPSDVPEVPHPGECAPAFARRMALEKARAVARFRPDAWVCGADTIVVAGGEILGKPGGPAGAARMLARLSGCAHHVLTGVALIGPGGALEVTRVAASVVEFRPVRSEEIDAYVASGEPLDKAGAYAIQGGAAGFVRQVSGSYSNVVGLPIDELRTLLVEHGLLPGAAART